MKLFNFMMHLVGALSQTGRRGATMLETLVVLALFALISLAFMSLYFQHKELYTMGQAQFGSVGGARGALNGISAYAVQARRVVASQTISGILYTTGASTLVLEIPAINQSGDIIENTFDYAAFYASGAAMYRTIAPSAQSSRAAGARLLAEHVTSLLFTYDNADLAQVKKVTASVTSTAGTGSAQEVYYESVDFILRNY